MKKNRKEHLKFLKSLGLKGVEKAKESAKTLGHFEVRNGIILSDPCYKKDTWCALEIPKDRVKQGVWEASVCYKDKRCSKLMAFHENFVPRNIKSADWKPQNDELGVDSGQLGIYDSEFYNDCSVAKHYKFIDEEHKNLGDNGLWYGMNCDITLSDVMAGILPYGCVSSSGYGDGAYLADYLIDNKKIVGIRITFIEG